MSTTALNPEAEQEAKANTISIEIDPSPPLILAIAQLFRAYRQPDQAVRLCRLGLNYFPGDMGLRLGTAMAYMDLNEKDRAMAEIKAVAGELNLLAEPLKSVAGTSRNLGLENLTDWFIRLSQILSNYPGEGQGQQPAPALEGMSTLLREGVESEPHRRQDPEKPAQKDTEAAIDFRVTLEEEARPSLDPKVLSTLNKWLSQLKEGRT
jgi:hypothetical protein